MPYVAHKGGYKREKVDVLARCLSQQQYQTPLEWKSTHGCVLVDRCERHGDGSVACFGFVRGTVLSRHQDFHIPGYDDVRVSEMSVLPDPALPDQKLVLSKARPVLYAPMSEIADIKVDDEAIHVRVAERAKTGKAARAQAIINSIQVGGGESGAGNGESGENGEKDVPGITLFGDDDTVVQDLAPARVGPGEPLSGDEDAEYAEEGEELGEDESSAQEDDGNAWMDGESSADASVQSESTDANLDEVDQEALKRAAGMHEDEELEGFEEGLEGEEESELSEQRADNEATRIAHHMRRMRLEKPQASRQYYHDMIYGYYKRPDVRAAAVKASAKKAVSNARKPGLLQLFDDEPEDKDLIHVDLFPADFAPAVAPLPFEQRDSTRVYPIETQLVGGELTLPGDFGADEYAKYFLGDTDFVEAVHKCLDGEGI